MDSVKFMAEHVVLVLVALGLMGGGFLWAIKYIFRGMVTKIDEVSRDVKEISKVHNQCRLSLNKEFTTKDEYIKLREDIGIFRKEVSDAFLRLDNDRNRRWTTIFEGHTHNHSGDVIIFPNKHSGNS